jgi:phosphoribosylanthranilate isomerase
MARTKVCGVTRETDLRAVVDAGADAVGVVSAVSVDTPREVAPDHAAELVASAPPFLTTTLVTMPETPERAAEIAGAVAPDVLQVHANFDAADLRAVDRATRSKLMVAVDADDAGRARALASVADAVLLDSTTEEGAGGTGRTHDWEAAADLVAELDVPVVLAGGLTPANVAEAVGTVDPFAVDVASGVEREGGLKDHDAVRAFVDAARSRGVTA